MSERIVNTPDGLQRRVYAVANLKEYGYEDAWSEVVREALLLWCEQKEQEKEERDGK